MLSALAVPISRHTALRILLRFPRRADEGVESVKAATDVCAPADSEVTAVNEAHAPRTTRA
ncbi:hypothetical protein ABCR94_13520 [Streptomyces sp. 21So2-11]|uniref:hypothetical protein n=1 Tax=Streptomyces sp. 21So2-11 TaxID=3144408 RepID=UPI00321BC82E